MKGESDISMPVAVDFEPETAQAEAQPVVVDDDAYKRQSPTWVDPAPPVHADVAKLWAAIQEELRMTLPMVTWHDSIQRTEAVSFDGTTLAITNSNPAICSVLSSRMANAIRRSASAIAGTPVTLVVDTPITVKR